MSHRIFQIVQALLILILFGGGIFIAQTDLAYGLIFIGFALVLFLYDRRGFLMTLLANQAFRKKGLEGALGWLRRAWKAKALDPKTQITYAYLLMKAGHLEEAASTFQAMSSPGPWYVGQKNLNLLNTYKAMLLWNQGQRKAAADLLWDLLETSYKTTALLTTLGVYLLELKDWARFEKLLPICQDYDNEDAGLLDNEGAYLLERNRLEEAYQLYRDHLIPKNPNFPDAYVHWARVCRRLGNIDEARLAYQRALRCPFHALSSYSRQQVEQEYREVAS